MHLRASLPRFVFVLLLTVAASLCAAQTYTVTDLGTLPGGSFSGAKAINLTAEITGWAYSSSTVSDVFLYSNGAMTNLGTLGGPSGIGNGINKSGQVAGYSTNSSGTYRAFLASGGSITDIGAPGGGSAGAYPIHHSREGVGPARTAAGSDHPFLHSNEPITSHRPP